MTGQCVEMDHNVSQWCMKFGLWAMSSSWQVFTCLTMLKIWYMRLCALKFMLFLSLVAFLSYFL